MNHSKFLVCIEDEKVSLEVYECLCGFHIGLDATYTDQVADIDIDCPVCSHIITTKEKTS